MNRIIVIFLSIACAAFLVYAGLSHQSDDRRTPVDEALSALEYSKKLQNHPATCITHLMRQPVGDTLGPFSPFDSSMVPFFSVKVYSQDDRISSASITRRAFSGDWAMYTDYFFRKDSSLAAVFSDLRTSHGDIRIETLILLDPAGNTIQRKASVYDLFSGEPVDRKGMGRDPELYMSIVGLEDMIGRDRLTDSTDCR